MSKSDIEKALNLIERAEDKIDPMRELRSEFGELCLRIHPDYRYQIVTDISDRLPSFADETYQSIGGAALSLLFTPVG